MIGYKSRLTCFNDSKKSETYHAYVHKLILLSCAHAQNHNFIYYEDYAKTHYVRIWKFDKMTIKSLIWNVQLKD